MYEGQLPYIKHGFATKPKTPQDENTAANKLPLVTNRDKISFRCLNGFLQMRIRNSRTKNQGSSRFASFINDKQEAEYRIRELSSILNIKDSQLANKPVFAHPRRSISDLNSKQTLKTNRINVCARKVAARSSAVKTRSRNHLTFANAPIESFKESQVCKVNKRTSIKLLTKEVLE